MTDTDVQVEVAIKGKIQKERASYLQERIYEEIGKSVLAECQTLDSALSGESRYDYSGDLLLFKIEINVTVDRRLSQRFLKFIVDNALKEVFTDLGREWAMESIENAVDTVTETVGKAWDSATSALARGLKSAAEAIEGEKSSRV